MRGDRTNFNGRPIIPTQFVEDTMVFHKDSKDALSHPPSKDDWRNANWRGFNVASYSSPAILNKRKLYLQLSSFHFSVLIH